MKKWQKNKKKVAERVAGADRALMLDEVEPGTNLRPAAQLIVIRT